jgi:sulfur dioxygenase
MSSMLRRVVGQLLTAGSRAVVVGSKQSLVVNCTAGWRWFAAASAAQSPSDTQSDYIFRPLFDEKTWTYTFLLGDPESREAVIIDPVHEQAERDVKLARELDLNLVYGLNTHMHADHVTGTGMIRKRVPTFKSVIAKATPARADRYIVDGDIINFGKFELECRSTPGHTDGCMTFVWHEKAMVFTGDAVLIRKCGRTDFGQGDPEKLYRAVHEKIFTLPDHFLLYPGHDYEGHIVSTVGEEKKWNTRLNKPLNEFVYIMKNLNLPLPKYIDVAVPGNIMDGNVDSLEELALQALRAAKST